jgi:uncharacterized membrane protein YgaE (UPF0421/DUF939 family)
MKIFNKLNKVHIGPRIVKTAVAVFISMIIVGALGTTESRLIFAMLGAMAAMEPTFKASLESCLTQIVGVIFGALMGSLLMLLPIPGLLAACIGIVLVITVYNVLGVRFSPGLPSLIVVMMCTTEDIQPISYALGRIWDTAIGMTVGIAINTLVYPYDNRRQIRSTAAGLERAVIRFLEDMFDGDDILPDAEAMTERIGLLARQLDIFSQQRFFYGHRYQNRDLQTFRLCEGKARELLARMTVLSQMGIPGRLTDENRALLAENGANILDTRPLDEPTERDIVTNYHVRQILTLRQELLGALEH